MNVCVRPVRMWSFGADLIAGFPTETEEMFQNTLDIVEECGLTWLHVFPYSEREGTPAAKIPNSVPKAVRKERAARLRALGAEMEQKFLASQVGREAMVLFERNGVGRTEQFTQVRFDREVEDGALVHAKITGVEGKMLLAKPAREAAA